MEGTSYEYDCCDGSQNQQAPDRLHRPGNLSGPVRHRPRTERRPRPSRHGPQALLYQRRVSDRQAAVQQPYQFRAVRRHPRRAGRCRKNLSDIEEVEPEPSLGNGGLGRLAACFLDSLATLNLPGDGVGLRYHFGLFHQSFKDGVQNELPDPWLTAHCWAEKTDATYPVELAGKNYSARLYKLAVTGYEGRTNTLNLFDLDTIDESIVHDGITFDKTDIDKNLTLFLYPDDSDEAGRRLRVYQQYLMVSAGAQLILAECAARGCDYHDLADYAAIQINDTHPSMVIPELIRLLGEKGIEFDEAVEIVTKTCAYTNHTILAEALEKWPRAYLDAVVPQLMPIIEKLDALARTRTEDESLAIIDKDDRVHMAHMDIHFTHSTNGVAYPAHRNPEKPSCTASMSCTPKSSTTRPTASPSAAGCWSATRH